jgi:hypothetical protein
LFFLNIIGNDRGNWGGNNNFNNDNFGPGNGNWGGNNGPWDGPNNGNGGSWNSGGGEYFILIPRIDVKILMKIPMKRRQQVTHLIIMAGTGIAMEEIGVTTALGITIKDSVEAR